MIDNIDEKTIRALVCTLIIACIAIYDYIRKNYELIEVHSDYLEIQRLLSSVKLVYSDSITSFRLIEKKRKSSVLRITTKNRIFRIRPSDDEKRYVQLVEFARIHDIDFYIETDSGVEKLEKGTEPNNG
ncbi:MAG: hypothetical protein CMP59_05430 [Flavobacteriales bacterium]|nr:hypothetical protein [Flavobacteriales bacterium]|tara:strand:+ start:95 stop:481 length:387 start_codon:yes stop_codon:yes gene_type:complete